MVHTSFYSSSPAVVTERAIRVLVMIFAPTLLESQSDGSAIWLGYPAECQYGVLAP